MKEYNKEKFISLVKKSISDRDIKSFSKETGLSYDYVLRLLNGKFDNRPKRPTIQKIASASKSVSYNEFMDAAGYTENSSDMDIIGISPSVLPNSLFNACLLSELSKKDITWSIKKENKEFPLSINCKDMPYDKWSFIFLDKTKLSLLENRLYRYYINLLFSKIRKKKKISFVTNQKEEFNLYKEKIPYNLSVNLTLILIDTSTLTVIKEIEISKNHNMNKPITFF